MLLDLLAMMVIEAVRRKMIEPAAIKTALTKCCNMFIPMG